MKWQDRPQSDNVEVRDDPLAVLRYKLGIMADVNAGRAQEPYHIQDKSRKQRGIQDKRSWWANNSPEPYEDPLSGATMGETSQGMNMVKTKKDLQPGFRQQRQEARAQAQYEAAPPQPSIQDQILQLLMADPNSMTPKVSRVRSPGTLMRSNGEAAAQDANAEAEGAAEPGDGPAEDKAEGADPALIAQIAGQGQKLQNASVAPSDGNLEAVSGVDPTQMNALLQGFMALPPEAQQRLLAAMSGVGGQIQPAQAPADAAPADAVLQKVLGQR